MPLLVKLFVDKLAKYTLYGFTLYLMFQILVSTVRTLCLKFLLSLSRSDADLRPNCSKVNLKKPRETDFSTTA